MTAPYGLTADIHCHDWRKFSRVNPDGVNSRLRIILDELERAAAAVKAAGGKLLVVAGDLFHVRGKIQPSVFNPTYEAFQRIAATGIRVAIIPGNHDLETDDSTKLGNAMQALDQIPGVDVWTEPTRINSQTGLEDAQDGDIVVVPWIEKPNEVMAMLRDIHQHDVDNGYAGKTDVIIHAPLNGVLRDIPDTGLDPAALASIGLRRVFAGHYHDHTEAANNVWSIGASTHQTWSDVGTKAGFLLVGNGTVKYHESAAPQFIDITEDIADEAETYADGNYVRLKLTDVSEKEIAEARDQLTKWGALGIEIIATKKATSARTGTAPKAVVTLSQSITEFVRDRVESRDKARLQDMAQSVFNEATTLAS